MQAMRGGSQSPIGALHRSIGNRAVGRLIERHRSVFTRVQAPSGPVVQGVFIHIGNSLFGDPPIPRAVFKDSDTGGVYVWIHSGPVTDTTGRPAYLLVRRQDGFQLTIRPAATPGEWEPIEDKWTRERRLDPGKFEPIVKVPRPKGIRTDSDEMEVSEEPTPEPTFTQTTESIGPSSQQQAENQLLSQDFRLARLATAFTAQFELVPVQQGVASSSSLFGSLKYSAEMVGVARCNVGDNDRPDTYLEPKKGKSNIPQGRHTVAWAFIRRWLMSMAGRTLDQILDQFITAFEHMVPLVDSREGQFLLTTIHYPDGLDSIRNAQLSLDVWQRNLSQLARVYAQIYHLSSGALFAGTSKQRGESPGVQLLQWCEDKLAENGELPAMGKIKKAATDLLDVTFSVEPSAFAFAVYHWVITLMETYPRLMAKHGTDIVADKLGTKVSAGYPKRIGNKNIKTVADVLSHFGYVLPDYATAIVPTELEGELEVEPFEFEDLVAHFTASVSLTQVEQGRLHAYVVSVGGMPVTQTIVLLKASDLVVHDIMISDQDRPQTKAGRTQQSHTVAWTLVRADLVSYKFGRVLALLKFLSDSFAAMDKDVSTERTEARSLLSEATTALQGYDTREMPINDWQAYISTLVKWYAHIYQVTDFATFHDPRTARPEGHGEGTHMAVLRRNEAALFDLGQLVDKPERVVQAATALFDAYVKVGADSNIEQRFVTAYHHWLAALKSAFPTLMSMREARAAITSSIRNRNVGTATQSQTLGAVLDR